METAHQRSVSTAEPWRSSTPWGSSSPPTSNDSMFTVVHLLNLQIFVCATLLGLVFGIAYGGTLGGVIGCLAGAAAGYFLFLTVTDLEGCV